MEQQFQSMPEHSLLPIALDREPSPLMHIMPLAHSLEKDKVIDLIAPKLKAELCSEDENQICQIKEFTN